MRETIKGSGGFFISLSYRAGVPLSELGVNQVTRVGENNFLHNRAMGTELLTSQTAFKSNLGLWLWGRCLAILLHSHPSQEAVSELWKKP